MTRMKHVKPQQSFFYLLANDMTIHFNVFCAIYYIMHVFWYVSTDNACIYAFALCLMCYVICFGHVIHEYWCLHFLRFVMIFVRIFWAFYVAFCAYRPRPIQVAETDPSQCPPSRRLRPRLWTMPMVPIVISHYHITHSSHYWYNYYTLVIFLKLSAQSSYRFYHKPVGTPYV